MALAKNEKESETKKTEKFLLNINRLLNEFFLFTKNSVQFSRFLFPPLVEQNTYINIVTLRKKEHATKRNNVETCKNSINYPS